MGFLFSIFGAGNLRSKLILFGLVAVLLGGGYFVYSQKMQILKAKEETLQVKGERDQAMKDRDAAVDANKVTNETLNRLLEERKNNKTAIIALDNRDKSNKAKIDKLNEIISSLSQNTESQVALSEILRETVRKIQADRDAAAQGETK